MRVCVCVCVHVCVGQAMKTYFSTFDSFYLLGQGMNAHVLSGNILH